MREDYQGLIDEVSALLGTPATLEGRDFGLIAFGAHDSDDDESMDPVRTRSILRRGSTPAVRSWFESFGITRARGPVRIPREPSAGVLHGRICLPARHGPVVYGYIWLLDDGALPLEDPRLAEAMALARRIGALLAGESRAGARLGELLRALLTAAPPVRERRTAELAAALGPAAGGPLLTMAVSPWAGDTAAAVPGGGLLASCTVPGEPTMLAALLRQRPDAVADRLLRAAPPGAVAGVSALTPLDGVPDAWAQACAAARAARAEERFAPVARWEALGPYRLLTALPQAPPDPAVSPLLRPGQRELARTAEAYLDHAGQAGRTAAALGIHRQTLYYRLNRVRQLTGLDLDDGESRLLLHLGLKAARLTGAAAGPAAGP